MRASLGWSTLGLVTAVSYVLQRLLAASDPLPESAVMAQEHIPFYWRCALALLQGVVVALVVALGVRDPARALNITYALILLLTPPLVLASLLVP